MKDQPAASCLMLLVMLVAGCASTAGPGATPYTADAIRLANVPGTTIVYRTERAGQPPVLHSMQFVSGDANGCVVQETEVDADGAPLGAPTRNAATWEELRDHALFPAERTTRSRARCTVPAGSFDCWRYAVKGEGEAGGPVSYFYFALDRAGPPVLYETVADGVAIFRMEMVEDSRGG